MIRFGPVALGFLILVAPGLACAGTDTETKLEPFSPLAFETYRDASFDWALGAAPNPNNLITTSLGPEGLYDAWGRSGMLLQDQLKRGDVAFIRGEMPLEFVIMVCTVGHPMTLYAGGDAKPFTKALTPVMWYRGDGPFENEGQLTVISSVELPQRFDSTWEELLKEKKPIVLESEEGARVRVRLTLTDEQIKRARSQEKEGVSRFSLAVHLDTGKVKGNEELADFLANRRGIRSTMLSFPSVTFQLMDKEVVEDYRWMDYQCWRIRYWCVHRYRHDYREQRLDAYEQFLKLVPKHEFVWLEYGSYLEEIGEYGKAIAVARKLIELVQQESREYPILAVEPSRLRHTAVLSSSDLPPASSPEELVKELNYHIDRLEKLKAEKAKDGGTGSETKQAD